MSLTPRFPSPPRGRSALVRFLDGRWFGGDAKPRAAAPLPFFAPHGQRQRPRGVLRSENCQMSRLRTYLGLAAMLCAAAGPAPVRADDPLVKFVSVPDFLNMDFQLNDPRLIDLTAARQA